VNWAKGIEILCLFGLLSLPLAGQRPAEHFRPPAQSNPPKNSNSGNKGGAQPGKMGQWLEKHKNLSPDQQEKLLENDPNFKKLPPARQAELRERLRKFNNLPPAQRERALNRMQYMASLSPEQRQQVREAGQQLQGLPQDRQVMVHKALRHLRQMDPQERQQILDSDRFKSTFSEQERGIITRLAAINPEQGAGAEPNPQPSGQPR
jgi:Protein of unknown function (DUF3106)